jgi:hypothetical protein
MNLLLSLLLAGSYQMVGSMETHMKDLHLTLKPTVITEKNMTAFDFLWIYQGLPESTHVDIVYVHPDGTTTLETHEVKDTRGPGKFRIGFTDVLLKSRDVNTVRYRWISGKRVLAEGILVR